MRIRRFVSRLPILTMALALVPVGLGAQLAAARTSEGTTEANITRLTTNLLESSQFSHHSFDSAMASTFLDRYLDSLDASRSLFLQTDVDEFGVYRSTLAEATRGAGDTTAARAIFARYLQRLSDRTAYVTTMLRTATFDFTGHDVYSFNREHASRPRDAAEAHELWRQELRSEYLQAKLGDKLPAQIVQTLARRYQQQLSTMTALKSGEILDIYLNALAHVYDPHSDYLDHEQMESLSIAMNLRLFGIGATLENADGYCKVRELVPGGPAARSGLLKPGDRIVAVAQAGKDPVDITSMPLSGAVELIRGPKGSTVTLTVMPAGVPEGSPPKQESIVRDQVKLEDQEAKARIVDLPSGNAATVRLGVIDLPSFYADVSEYGAHRSATKDVSRLLDKLKAEHVRGVILDLRRNGGGSLQEAINLAGLFIRKGPIVQTRDAAGGVEVGVDPDPSVQYDGPLVLLTSRFSASASEIVAGALQDYGRALVVGDSSTFGKGTVQNILPLARVMDRVHLPHAYDPGALKFTMSKFYRPSGASTQLRGVASDIVIPSTSDFSDVNESSLKDALPWDTIPSAPYDAVNRVLPFVDALRLKSADRVHADRQFGYLAEDMGRLQKTIATKSVSLNEAERREQLTDAKARQKLRDDAARSTLSLGTRAYEITLRNASSPGLPPPEPIAAPSGTSIAPKDEADEPSAGSSRREDLTLREGVHILADYVGLLPG